MATQQQSLRAGLSDDKISTECTFPEGLDGSRMILGDSVAEEEEAKATNLPARSSGILRARILDGFIRLLVS
jgi:hypothetical protein